MKSVHSPAPDVLAQFGKLDGQEKKRKKTQSPYGTGGQTMYEDLVNELRHYFEDVPLVLQAADAIEELQAQLMFSNDAAKAIAAKVPKWISVTERLPEDDGRYLTFRHLIMAPIPWIEIMWFAKDLHKIDRFEFSEHKSGFYTNDSDYGSYERLGVTHWMPLPEPPKEET